MPRKLRFYHTKNYEKKKSYKCRETLFLPTSIPLNEMKAFPVSIPLQLVQAPTLVTSFPICAYLSAPVTDLMHLSSRLASQSPLPGGWVELIDARQNDTLIFAIFTINSPILSATATCLIKVDNDLIWTMSCHGVQLETEHCQALAAIPQQITCVSDIMNLFSLVDGSRICCGNPIEDFKDLVDVHGGEFRDETGLSCMYMCDTQ